MARGESKQGVSFRFDPSTVERLKRRSREVGASQGALAERYIDEGMRIDEHPGIYFRDGGPEHSGVDARLKMRPIASDCDDVVATVP